MPKKPRALYVIENVKTGEFLDFDEWWLAYDTLREARMFLSENRSDYREYGIVKYVRVGAVGR